MTDEHIVTAKEPALSEKQYRPGEYGDPEEVPESLTLHYLDVGIEHEYFCSCGKEFRLWGDVLRHLKEVADEPVSSAGVVPEAEILGEQITLDEV